jgi:hypothetical protein
MQARTTSCSHSGEFSVLKILVSYPDGFTSMAELKRDMAILATSGRHWAEHTKRLAARVPNLGVFSQELVKRMNAGWRITEKDVSSLISWKRAQAKVAVETEVSHFHRHCCRRSGSSDIAPCIFFVDAV